MLNSKKILNFYMQKWSNFKNCCLYSKEVSNAVSSHSLRLSRLDNLMWPLAWMWVSEWIFIKRFFFFFKLLLQNQPTHPQHGLFTLQKCESTEQRDWLTAFIYRQSIRLLNTSHPPNHPPTPLHHCPVSAATLRQQPLLNTSVLFMMQFYDGV